LVRVGSPTSEHTDDIGYDELGVITELWTAVECFREEAEGWLGKLPLDDLP